MIISANVDEAEKGTKKRKKTTAALCIFVFIGNLLRRLVLLDEAFSLELLQKTAREVNPYEVLENN